MKRQTYTLELLTPCFCAGADQSKAEIRASSIRGQLRWWFRALGGSTEDERAVFGGMAGSTSASILLLRVKNVEAKGWSLPAKLDIASDSYVYHFAKVSGTEVKGESGPRWKSSGSLGPKTTFEIELLQKARLEDRLQRQLDDAKHCFLELGSIGLRATRGLGSFVCKDRALSQATLDLIVTKNFKYEIRSGSFASHDIIAKEIGKLVKGTRKVEGWTINDKISTQSPLGTSSPRQTSAVYFRPVRQAGENTLRLVVFQAPDSRVLDPNSQKGTVIGRLSYPPPPAPRSARRW
jgi:CRISPR/Cas system CMR-associated protein Cmr1 (group 7 of RAMP superfamily)